MLRREGHPEFRGREPVPRVVIVGDRNSGKTTFLGLLYAAQVKFGSDKADGFRFHAAFESLDEISGVFQRLMSGTFPDAATKEGVREIAFRLSHRRTGLGILSRRRSRGSSPESSASFKLILLKSFEDEIARSGERGSVDQRTLSSALTGDAIVIMVDATSLAVAEDVGDSSSRRLCTFSAGCARMSPPWVATNDFGFAGAERWAGSRTIRATSTSHSSSVWQESPRTRGPRFRGSSGAGRRIHDNVEVRIKYGYRGCTVICPVHSWETEPPGKRHSWGSSTAPKSNTGRGSKMTSVSTRRSNR